MVAASTVTEIVPDGEVLRRARRARVLDAMEERGIDVLVVGREANARYASGAPRLWTAGSRAFGPGCIVVRETGAVHLLTTWDQGVPDDIPHENLYGISFNGQTFLRVLQGIDASTSVRTLATDGLTPGTSQLLGAAFPSAEIVDGDALLRRVRQVKLPDEIDAIRRAVAVTEQALVAARGALRPGITERALTGVFMEAMAATGVTTPAGQDVAWITSRAHPWRRTSRDAPIVDGDVVVLEGGVVLDGYSGELGRTYAAGSPTPQSESLVRRCDELRGGLLDACRPGAPLSALLDAYAGAGVEPPPMPVARGLGLGFDLPLVTATLPHTAAEATFEPGMVFALTAYVWEHGVGGVEVLEPVVVTEAGPEVLATVPPRGQGD